MITAIYETVLYAADVPAAAAFYHQVLGLLPARPPSVESARFCLSPDAFLLLFNPDWSEKAGRGVPAHAARGPGHIAFHIPGDSVESWKATLASHAVPIEMERGWDPGGRSIYVRDPAGNSVELAAGDVWGPTTT